MNLQREDNDVPEDVLAELGKLQSKFQVRVRLSLPIKRAVTAILEIER